MANNDVELKQLTDRDLLILVTQSVNDVKGVIIEIKGVIMDQEKRIRGLESWRSVMAGGLAVLVFLTTVFGVFMLSKLSP